MSRCFPYPHPGFTKKASDVATLIDSIKLQKENKANTEKRKEKRRDKGDKKDRKEKKKEKKEKKKPVNTKQTEVGYGKNCTESDGVVSQKRKREETEQLEGSSVTEEHGQPLNLQNPSYSSDGTQNSNKRRNHASAASDSRGHGNIIRIKLPLQKHRESESTVSKEQLDSTPDRNVENKESNVRASNEQPCSTSGRNEMHSEQFRSRSGLTDIFVYPGQDVSRASQGDVSLTSLSKNNSLQSSTCPSNELLHCSTSGNADDFAQGLTQISVSVPVSCSTSQDKKMQKKVSKYENLIQNLYQIAVPSEIVDNDGEDWLFGGKPRDRVVKRNVEKQVPVNSGVTCCSGSSTLYPLYPRAQYLEEAEIYALPYTVPF